MSGNSSSGQRPVLCLGYRVVGIRSGTHMSGLTAFRARAEALEMSRQDHTESWLVVLVTPAGEWIVKSHFYAGR